MNWLYKHNPLINHRTKVVTITYKGQNISLTPSFGECIPAQVAGQAQGVPSQGVPLQPGCCDSCANAPVYVTGSQAGPQCGGSQGLDTSSP